VTLADCELGHRHGDEERNEAGGEQEQQGHEPLARNRRERVLEALDALDLVLVRDAGTVERVRRV
jgi:hypothetical protein